MVVQYEVQSTREDAVSVDGLGVVPPESVVAVDPVLAESFKANRGLPLTQAALPEGVTVTVVVDEKVS